MAIHKPEKVLLHHIPLKFVSDRVGGGGKKSVNQEIPLIPFIDFLIVLTVFLLSSFGSKAINMDQQNMKLPSGANTNELEQAPVLSISTNAVMLNGKKMSDYETLKDSPTVEPIEALVQNLELLKKNWPMLHPGEDFPGTLILQADEKVDFRVIKKVMFSSAQSGFANVNFAVNKKGGN